MLAHCERALPLAPVDLSVPVLEGDTVKALQLCTNYQCGSHLTVT